MTAPRDPDRLIHAFLLEGEEQLHDQVYDAVRAAIEHKPQRAGLGPWRTPTMNKFVVIGLGAAAVIVALIVGSNLIGSSSPRPGGAPSDSVAPSQAPSEPAPSAWVGVPAGRFLWFDPTNPLNPLLDGPPITITIAASGWTLPGWEGLIKGDQVDNVPESWLLYASTTAGILVYGDPCPWQDLAPDTPATTADEIVAALAVAQLDRDASDPVDVTLGGYAGRMVTLHVPNNAVFSDCNGGIYASYGIEGQNGVPWRVHQGPGQIDEFWVVDVDGDIVIIDAAYRPDTSTERIDEMHTMIESARFEVP